jgi:hypothetical protein
LFVRIQHFAHPFCHVTAGNQEDDDEEDEDFSINESGEEGESLGSVDTDIEENEVNDLQTVLDDNMPSARKSSTPKKAAPKSVDALSTQMSSMKVTKVEYFSFDWRFPMAMYSVNEGTTKKIYIELLKGVQLPEEYIVHAKVLPRGRQFSFLCGVPRYMYEEVYMDCRMGVHCNTSSAIFQAFGRFVIQPVLALFPEKSSFFKGIHDDL